MTITEGNQRLVGCLRGLMRAWARRWKHVHKERDPVMVARRQTFIEQATALRDKARQWSQRDGRN